MSTIAVTGGAMVSSLGLDADTACSAARAGLTRPLELDYFGINSAVTGESEYPVGHGVPLLTRGFEGEMRLRRLFDGALADLAITFNVADQSRCGWFFSLPPERNCTGTESDYVPNQLAQALLVAATNRLNLGPNAAILAHVNTLGHAGVIHAIGAAQQGLQSGTIDIAIVCGLDSLIDMDVLAWLRNANRLKCDAIPTGLQPGESCAMLLLETVDRVRTRARPIKAVLSPILQTAEPNSCLSNALAAGDALANMVTNLATQYASTTQSPWIVFDHNGENYRAVEWGNAIAGLAHRSLPLANAIFWYPAASFGDCGAASGAVHLNYILRAFMRNYAPRNQALLVSCSDGPERASLVLTRSN